MKVDVHAHLFPSDYLDLLARFGDSAAGTAVARDLGADRTPADLARRIHMMDRAGIDLQILSICPQSPHLADETHAIEAARFINDSYADIVRAGSGRFGAFAALPLPHVAASLAEISRALDKRGMLGICVTTAIAGAPLADERFAPIFAELDRRGAVLFIHPVGLAGGSPAINEARLTWPLGAPLEDTLCLLQLLQARIPERFPNVQIISAHLGGCFPMLKKRLDVQAPWYMPAGVELPGPTARSFWFDTVNGYPPALRCACEAVGADRLLLGTDSPYWQDELYQLAVDYVAQAGLSAAEVDGIYGGNAVRLFGDKLTDLPERNSTSQSDGVDLTQEAQATPK